MFGLKTQPASTSFIDNVKNFDFKAIIQHIKNMNINWMEMITLVVVGIGAGFVVKRFFKTIMLCLFASLIAMIVLEHVGFIVIRWSFVQDFFGHSPAQTVEMFCQSCYLSVRSHFGCVVSFLIGFFIGIKVG